MTEPRHVRDMTDDELVDLIKGLPERAPRAGLRDRVLAAAAPAAPRWRLRPALGLAALVLLLVADWATLRVQDGARVAPALPAVVAQAKPAPREDRSEFAAAGLSVRVALRPTGLQPVPYLEVCKRLLREADGG